MLLAVTLFFALIGLFFLSFQLTNIKKQFISLEEENSKKIVSTLAQSPEFICSGKRAHCIDFDKALIMQNRNEYIEFWQVDSIVIRKLYPESNSTVYCNKINYPDCTELVIFQGSGKNLVPQQSSFVDICRKEESGNQEICELGILLVGINND